MVSSEPERADREPAGIGFHHLRQFQQLAHCGVYVGERPISGKFHCLTSCNAPLSKETPPMGEVYAPCFRPGSPEAANGNNSEER
jgi:hypothetical protein